MKNKLIHLMILTCLMAGGGVALTSNLYAQENFDPEAAIEARDYATLIKYYQGLADEQREIAEESHNKMQKSQMSYTYTRGSQAAWEASYREPIYEALEKAEEYDRLAEKYEKLTNEN